MVAHETRSWLQRLLPLAGVVFPLLTFLSPDTEQWIRITAIGFSSVVLLVWATSEAELALRRWTRRRRSERLTALEASELRALVSDLDVLSYNYTLGPFYFWHSMSNDPTYLARMDYRYHGAIHTWIEDLGAALADNRRVPTVLAISLSKAILECGRLVERVSEDVSDYLKAHTLDSSKDLQLRQDWETARENFNYWIRDFNKTFRAINDCHEASCVTRFPVIPPLGHHN